MITINIYNILLIFKYTYEKIIEQKQHIQIDTVFPSDVTKLYIYPQNITFRVKQICTYQFRPEMLKIHTTHKTIKCTFPVRIYVKTTVH